MIETIWKKSARERITVIDAERAAEICGCSAETFRKYVRARIPKNNPPPVPVTRDLESGVRLWDKAEVEAWQASRRGPGRWGEHDRWDKKEDQ